MKLYIAIIINVILFPTIYAQIDHELVLNGGFEGTEEILNSWSFPKGQKNNHPDLYFTEGNYWNIKHVPNSGVSYLCVVVRDDGTYESLAQKMELPLVSGKNYKFSIYLAHSTDMKSVTIKSGNKMVPFSTPTKLKIYSGRNMKNRELVYETKGIINEDWKKYEFLFSPTILGKRIWIEAAYSSENDDHYNGNILIDDLSVKFNSKE